MKDDLPESPLESLNFHHLRYFAVVAREGSFTLAAKKLGGAQSTVSAQVAALEASLGVSLFVREGRRLSLTEAGRKVKRYADDIFALGKELVDDVHGRRGKDARLRLVVGVDNVLPKLVAYRLIEPAYAIESLELYVREGSTERLLGELAVHDIDVLLTDRPTSPGVAFQPYDHALGESAVSVFAAPALAERLKKPFPSFLDGAPMLLPRETSSLRLGLEAWLAERKLRPFVAGTFDDSALLKAFGQAGRGLFVAPSILETEIARQYGVRIVGRIDAVRERYFAVSVERRIKHPAVVAMTRQARALLSHP